MQVQTPDVVRKHHVSFDYVHTQRIRDDQVGSLDHMK